MDKELWQQITDLTSRVATDEFSEKVYALILSAADITHYGIFVFDTHRLVDPELVFYGGDISDYWMKVYALNDRHATLDENVIYDKNLENISLDKSNDDEFYRYSPDMKSKSEIQKIYQDSDTYEKYYLLQRSDDRLFQFNVYRSNKSGPFTEQELMRLREMLPFLNNLVKLRTQICGAGEFQRRPRKHQVSELRKRDVPLFKNLSKREVQVCDLIVYGLTAEGVASELGLSLSSVKTFRSRAYRKLDITSKSELFVMILNSNNSV